MHADQHDSNILEYTEQYQRTDQPLQNILSDEVQNNDDHQHSTMFHADVSEHGLRFAFDVYSGPLDVLLELVREHKIDVHNIPIARLTDCYLKRINELCAYQLEDLTKFYVLASWLLLIKSRTLLPISNVLDDGEIHASKNELINILIEYQKHKTLSEKLHSRYIAFHWTSFRQIPKDLPVVLPSKHIWKDVSLPAMHAVFVTLMKKNNLSPHIIDMHEVATVQEKLALLHEILEKKDECSFEEVIAGGGIVSVVCAFLAVLELMKQQVIKAKQHQLNNEIRIYKRA